jgi:hypothetical protein
MSRSPGGLLNLDFGWSFQNPACASSHRSRGLWSRDPGGSCDARHHRPNPGGHCRPGLVRDDKNATPFATLGPEIKTMKSEDGEDGNKIQLMRREMECKNNRWEEDRRRKGLSKITVGGWRGILPGRFLSRDRRELREIRRFWRGR